ncbi:MAG: hypothetical protein M3Q17_01410 [Actinomycetota bacterium]|nr:hypothetical protein [Actinomycetota bacterium]
MHSQPRTDLEQVAQHHIDQRIAMAQQHRLCAGKSTFRCRTARTLRRLAAAFDPDA